MFNPNHPQKLKSKDLLSQQLKLLDVIRGLDEFISPRFKVWLTSTSRYVVLFALRLIKYHQQNDANALVVDFEEVLHKPAIGTNVFFDTNANTHSIDFDNGEFDFLPLVVDNSAETIVDATLKDELKRPDTIDNDDVGQIEVQFEEISTADIKEEIDNANAKSALSEETNKDTLRELENTPISNIGYEFYNSPEILAINIDFEEVLVGQDEKSQNIYDIEVICPCYVSYNNMNTTESAIDVEFNEDRETSQIQDEMTPKAEQSLKAIINDLIDLENKEQLDEIIEEFENWPNEEVYDEIIDLDFIPLVNDMEASQDAEPKNNVDQSNIEVPIEDIDTIIEHETSEEVEFGVSQISIPNRISLKEDCEQSLIQLLDGIAELGDHREIQLLDGIAELGDHREIPLLNELLANEKSAATRNCILSLLAKLTEGPSPISEDSGLRPFNVFEDLFRTCDTESKLILLDEVVAVGDKKDIVFLEDLLEDKEPKIRSKATTVIEELRIKLKVKKDDLDSSIMKDKNDLTKGKPSEKEISMEYTTLLKELNIEPPSDQSGIFYIEFELTEDLEKDNGNESNAKEETISENEAFNSFFGQLCSIPSKIIEKLNGQYRF